MMVFSVQFHDSQAKKNVIFVKLFLHPSFAVHFYLFGMEVDFTFRYLQIFVKGFLRTVWKNENFSLAEKIFREISSFL